jgi:hypothetical protein
LALRLSDPLFALALASAVVVGCGGASGTDFESGDSVGGKSGTGGSDQGGSDQGGTGGTSSGSGGSSQGGSTGTGGASGTGTGGGSGTDTGGASGTGNGGTGGTDPTGGTGGGGAGQGGAGQGGAAGVSGRAGNGGQGGDDCTLAVQRAQAALSAAQLCNPLVGSNVCTGKVEDLCGCQVPVADQNSEQTKTYLELREPAVKCGVPCLAIPCMEPTTPMCGIAGGVSAIVAATSCRWSPR